MEGASSEQECLDRWVDTEFYNNNTNTPTNNNNNKIYKPPAPAAQSAEQT